MAICFKDICSVFKNYYNFYWTLLFETPFTSDTLFQWQIYYRYKLLKYDTYEPFYYCDSVIALRTELKVLEAWLRTAFTPPTSLPLLHTQTPAFTLMPSGSTSTTLRDKIEIVKTSLKINEVFVLISSEILK